MLLFLHQIAHHHLFRLGAEAGAQSASHRDDYDYRVVVKQTRSAGAADA
jgi:hypothetical protein